jgi:hypothetical protein
LFALFFLFALGNAFRHILRRDIALHLWNDMAHSAHEQFIHAGIGYRSSSGMIDESDLPLPQIRRMGRNRLVYHASAGK